MYKHILLQIHLFFDEFIRDIYMIYDFIGFYAVSMGYVSMMVTDI